MLQGWAIKGILHYALQWTIHLAWNEVLGFVLDRGQFASFHELFESIFQGVCRAIKLPVWASFETID
jgi:hypothetical protein